MRARQRLGHKGRALQRRSIEQAGADIGAVTEARSQGGGCGGPFCAGVRRAGRPARGRDRLKRSGGARVCGRGAEAGKRAPGRLGERGSVAEGAWGQKLAPGVVVAKREKSAPLGPVREVKGVAGSGFEVLVGVGRAHRRSRDKVLGDGGARAYLLPEERRAVVEAASPMGTCSFLVRSFCRVRGLRTDARASGLGAVMCWMLLGMR